MGNEQNILVLHHTHNLSLAFFIKTKIKSQWSKDRY